MTTEREPTYLDAFFGPAKIKQGTTLLPKRTVVRFDGVDDTVVFDDPTNAETVIDLTALVAGAGSAPSGLAAENIGAGQFLCTASDAGDSTKLLPATAANLVAAGHVVGMATETVILGATLKYAPVGHIVEVSGFFPPGSGKPTPVIIDPTTARAVLATSPASSSYRGGIADGTTGFITIDPKPPIAQAIRPHDPVFGAKFSGASDDTDALRAALDAALVTTAGLNYSASPIEFPAGSTIVTKPLHVKNSGSKILGAGKDSTVVRSEQYVGPTFYVGPDVGEFPVTPNAFAGGNAAILHGAEEGVSLRSCLDLREYGAGWDLHGKSAFCFRIQFRFRTGWYAAIPEGGYLIVSYGEKTGNILTSPYDSVFGINVSPNEFQAQILTTAGVGTVSSTGAAAVAADDGNFHELCVDWDGTNIRLFLDGVLKGTTAIAGTLIQQDWETVRYGMGAIGGWNGGEVRGSVRHECASMVLDAASIHTTGYTPGATKLAFNGSTTLWWTDWDTLDGVFVQAAVRPLLSGGLSQAWIPHRLDDNANFAIRDVQIEQLTVTNVYGPGIDCQSAVSTRIYNVSCVCRTGIRLVFNSYNSNLTNVLFNNAPANARIALEMTGSAGIINIHGIEVGSSYKCAIVMAGASVSITGRCYLVANKYQIFAETDSLVIDGTAGISDETTTVGGIAVAGGFFFRGMDLVTLVGVGFGCFEEGGLKPFIEIFGSGSGHFSEDSSKYEFLQCQFAALPSHPGFIKVLADTDPTNVVRVVNCTKNDNPWFDNSDGVFCRQVVLPDETSGFGGIEIPTDADYTATFEEFKDGVIDVTSAGTLTDTRVVFLPLVPGNRRTFRNSTTGNQSIIVAGLTGIGVACANGATVEAFCDGTDWVPSYNHNPVLEPTAGDTIEAEKATFHHIRRVDWVSENGRVMNTEVFDATTTSVTPPSVFVMVVAQQSFKLIWSIEGHEANADAYSQVVTQQYKWNGSAIVEVGAAGGVVGDVFGTDFMPVLNITDAATGEISGDLTPPNTNSTKWRSIVQIVLAS
jgi:hypothetical protein